MAIEIKELVIRAQADYSDKNTPTSNISQENIDPQVLVETCVKQVLKILKQQQKR